MKKAKWLSEEALQTAKKRNEKAKGERERNERRQNDCARRPYK